MKSKYDTKEESLDHLMTVLRNTFEMIDDHNIKENRSQSKRLWLSAQLYLEQYINEVIKQQK